MNTLLLQSLLSDLSDDLHDPRFLWQVGTVLLCLGLAWWFARTLRTFFDAQDAQSGVVKLGVESFSRVLQPLLALVFIEAGRAILSKFQHVNLLSLLIPLIASLAMIRFGFYVFRRSFVREGQIGSFLAIFEKLFAGLVWLGVVLHFTGMWQDLFDMLDGTVLPVGQHKVSLLTILQACVSVVLTLLIALWASAALEARLMKITTMHMSMRVVLSRLGRTVLIVIAVLVSLTMVGIDLTVLSVFGGALGVGLGFGLQRITSSYVSGFIILLDRSLSIGDMIAVDKYNGKVTHINTRYTVVQGLDGSESVIPNEMLVSNPVQNFSLSDRKVNLSTDVIVSYKTDVEALLPKLVQATADVPRVSKASKPSAALIKFGSDGLELRVFFWIDDPENGRTGALSDVNRALWKTLQESGVELPYAQRVITFANFSEKDLSPSAEKARTMPEQK